MDRMSLCGPYGDRTPLNRSGFSLLELIIVVMVGGILAGLAAPPITSYWSGRQMIQARNAFILASAGARSTAVELGDLVVMSVYPEGDSIVWTDRAGNLIDVLELEIDGTRADLVGPEISVCYMPRGYVHPTCRDGGDLPASVGFARGGDTLWAEITLGQVHAQ